MTIRSKSGVTLHKMLRAFRYRIRIEKKSCVNGRPFYRSSEFRNLTKRYYSSDVKLTSERYPKLKRGDFAKLSTADVDVFKTILDENRVVTDEHEVAGKQAVLY